MEWEEKVYLCKGIIRDLFCCRVFQHFHCIGGCIPLINSHETVGVYRSSAVTLKKKLCVFILFGAGSCYVAYG